MEKIIVVFSLLIISIHCFELHQPWNPVEIAHVHPRISKDQMGQLMTTDFWTTLTSPDLVSKFIQAFPTTNDSCSRDIQTAVAALKTKDMASIELFDSWAKLPSGILQGNLQWLGSFDQCRNVSFDDKETKFKGRYCSARLGLKGGTMDLGPMSGLLYGFCVPSSCTEEDAKNVFGGALALITTTIKLVDLKCNIPQSYGQAEIGFISLSAVMLYLVLMGTIVDLTYRWKASKRTPELDASIPTEITGLLTGRDTSPHETVDVPRLARFCICFSALSNATKILSTSSSPKAVLCLNGIRVISMNWIVLCHTISFVDSFIDNPLVLLDVVKRFSFQAIINGFVSVDTFFFLSGFLVAYLTFLELEVKNGKLNWFLYYFHRIIRILPLYGFVIFFFVTMTKYLGDGPFLPYYVRSNLTLSCETYWWTNLLFINNFYPLYNYSCMQWSWYLANDMQFFLLSPILIYPLFRWRKIGALITFLMLLASTITYGVLNTYYGLGSSLFSIPTRKLPDNISAMDLTYIKPYTRIQPYIIGILAAYLLFRRRSLHIPKVVASIGWMTAAILGILVVYGLYPLYHNMTVQWDQSIYSLYNCTFRLVWGLVIAWVVVACHRRRGGPINGILSWKVWIPLSRLTYSVYLIHIIVLCIVFVNFRDLAHYTDLTLAVFYIAILVLSYATAFLFALLVEYPLLSVEEFLRKQY